MSTSNQRFIEDMEPYSPAFDRCAALVKEPLNATPGPTRQLENHFRKPAETITEEKTCPLILGNYHSLFSLCTKMDKIAVRTTSPQPKPSQITDYRTQLRHVSPIVLRDQINNFYLM